MEITKEGIESLGFKFHPCKSSDTDLTFSQKSTIEGYYLCVAWYSATNRLTIIHHNYDFIDQPCYKVEKLYDGTVNSLEDIVNILNSDGIRIFAHPVKD